MSRRPPTLSRRRQKPKPTAALVEAAQARQAPRPDLTLPGERVEGGGGLSRTAQAPKGIRGLKPTAVVEDELIDKHHGHSHRLYAMVSRGRLLLHVQSGAGDADGVFKPEDADRLMMYFIGKFAGDTWDGHITNSSSMDFGKEDGWPEDDVRAFVETAVRDAVLYTKRIKLMMATAGV